MGLLAILETVGFAVAFGGAIAAPYVATELDDSWPVRKLQRLLPFSGRTVDPDAVGEGPTPRRENDG